LDPKSIEFLDWHLFNKKDLLETLKTSDLGLTDDEVKARIAIFGLN